MSPPPMPGGPGHWFSVLSMGAPTGYAPDSNHSGMQSSSPPEQAYSAHQPNQSIPAQVMKIPAKHKQRSISPPSAPPTVSNPEPSLPWPKASGPAALVSVPVPTAPPVAAFVPSGAGANVSAAGVQSTVSAILQKMCKPEPELEQQQLALVDPPIQDLEASPLYYPEVGELVTVVHKKRKKGAAVAFTSSVAQQIFSHAVRSSPAAITDVPGVVGNTAQPMPSTCINVTQQQPEPQSVTHGDPAQIQHAFAGQHTEAVGPTVASSLGNKIVIKMGAVPGAAARPEPAPPPPPPPVLEILLQDEYGPCTSNLVVQMNGLISYYKSFGKRVDFGEVWRQGVNKGEKLVASLTRWLPMQGVAKDQRERLLQDMLQCILESWNKCAQIHPRTSKRKR